VKVVVFQCPRGLADEPPAPATSSVDADHLGVGAGLVDEHQLGGVKARLACRPAFARQGYVGPVLFGRVQRFFG
jgi:hypothetical protein